MILNEGEKREESRRRFKKSNNNKTLKQTKHYNLVGKFIDFAFINIFFY